MSKNTVDVIMPTYNGMPYLEQAVKSVLAQTHQDLKLYVIDDGSNDKRASEKYIKSLKDPRITFLKKDNGGPSSARNFGVSLSKSPFVAFIDSDDLWLPDKLELQLNLFKKNPDLGLVYGLSLLINDKGHHAGSVDFQKRGHLFRYLLKGNMISGSASMVLTRRAVLENIGLFKESFWNGEDWEMWLRISQYYEIDYVPKYLIAVRVHDNNAQNNNLKMASELEKLVPAMINQYKLGIFNRGRLAGRRYKEACFRYFNNGERDAARRTFLKALVYNPLVLFTLNYHVLFIYLRIVFGNESIRKIRRKVSTGYRQRESEHLEKTGK